MTVRSSIALIVFVPVAILLERITPDAHTLLFLNSVVAFVPLAALLSRATEAVPPGREMRSAALFASTTVLRLSRTAAACGISRRPRAHRLGPRMSNGPRLSVRWMESAQCSPPAATRTAANHFSPNGRSHS